MTTGKRTKRAFDTRRYVHIHTSIGVYAVPADVAARLLAAGLVMDRAHRDSRSQFVLYAFYPELFARMPDAFLVARSAPIVVDAWAGSRAFAVLHAAQRAFERRYPR